jgi:spore maturation protein SpmA
MWLGSIRTQQVNGVLDKISLLLMTFRAENEEFMPALYLWRPASIAERNGISSICMPIMAKFMLTVSTKAPSRGDMKP